MSPVVDVPELLEEATCYKGSGESVPLIGEEVHHAPLLSDHHLCSDYWQ